jgi:toxin ParE1/3/4
MPQILQTRTAVRDLDAIWDYIGIENAHPEAANELIDEFDTSYRLLATNPLMGQSVEWLSTNLRRFAVRKNYIIFYEPIANGILIVRVLHAARNITASLFETDDK